MNVPLFPSLMNQRGDLFDFQNRKEELPSCYLRRKEKRKEEFDILLKDD